MERIFNYLATVNKSEDAFCYTIYFVQKRIKISNNPKFLEWSKTVSFDKTSN